MGIPAVRGSSPYTPYLTYTSSFQIRYFCSHFWRRKLKPRDVSVLKVTYHVGGTRFEPRSSSSCLMAQTVKHLLTMWETWVRSLDREDPLRRKWQPTPVLLPGKSHGWRSLVGYSPWGHTESTEWLHFHSHFQLQACPLSTCFHGMY